MVICHLTYGSTYVEGRYLPALYIPRFAYLIDLHHAWQGEMLMIMRNDRYLATG